jgi:lipopolysaccharide/colanic/teichoic acid biosynthesis glycosyltransferase
MYKHFFKRFLDVLLSGLALLCLSPLLIVVSIWLHFANKGAGAFFTQERPGLHGKIFKVIKFKSMTDERDEKGELLPDADRLTKVGKFIRITSIDELLQLINVFKGDMSLIGPRPLLVKYLPYYTETEQLRHTVRPGITGWAQVNGRNHVCWDDRLALDVFYVRHISFALDCKIIYKTVINVLKHDGVDVVTSCNDLDFERKQRGVKEIDQSIMLTDANINGQHIKVVRDDIHPQIGGV